MTQDRLSRELGDHLREVLHKNVLSRREFLVRAGVLGFSATAAGSLLAACGGGGGTEPTASPSATTAPKAGGTMRVAMVGPVAKLDPVTMYDGGSIAVVQQMCEYLAWTENDLSLRPVLAESWTPNAAADTWTFKIRQGVTFTNGKPLTADDVVTTFKRLCDPKGVSAALSNFQDVLVPAGIRAVDANTVEFALESPFVDFPYLLSSSNYNCVVLPADYAGDFQKNPVGTGPFIMESYEQARGGSFKKNPGYWQQGRPYLDAVELTFSADIQAQVIMLQGGAADMMGNSPSQLTQTVQNDPNLKVDITPSTRVDVVHMRVDTEPFTDKRVRQAIAFCVDRPALLKLVFGSQGLVGNDSFFAPLYPNSPKDVTRSQDYAKAKQLLADAGHADGIKITLVCEEFLEEPQLAQALQQMCKPAGIDMKVQLMPQSEYYGSGDNQPWLTVPMGSTQWSMRPVPEQFYMPCLYTGGIWNSAHFSNAEFDALGKQYTSTLDESSRKQIAQKLAALQMDETPLLISVWNPAERAMKQNVFGVKADGSDYLNLTEAYLG